MFNVTDMDQGVGLMFSDTKTVSEVDLFARSPVSLTEVTAVRPILPNPKACRTCIHLSSLFNMFSRWDSLLAL